MFSTKKDVDRYAQDVLRRVKNERERNMRCYNIAVQYYKVRDFDSTRRYVCMYLAFKDDSASAHKLLGQALEGLKQKEKALAQYRRSVELEANQPELILKICELITDQDVHVDMEKARYWCDRAADLFPHHPVVFRLKERLLTNGTSNSTAAHYSKEFEDLISSELKSRPVDVNVHVRQLKLYMDTGRTQAAYAHAQEIEAKKLFAHEIQWYDYLTTLYKTYYDKNLPEVSDCEFFVNWTMVNERYVMLCLAENQTSPPKSITECGSAIYRFDEVLHKSYALLGNSKLYGQVSLSIKRFADFLEHMSAQLCLHLATFIFKKAKNEQGNWNEATRSAAPLLLFALVLAPPSEQQNMGGTPLKLLEREPLKNLPQWTMAAYHRHCQAGHVIVSLAKETQRQQFVDKVLHSCYKNWRERLFQKLFTFEETKNGLSTSHFVNHTTFCSPPRSDSIILRHLDDVIVQIPKQVTATATIHPGSLHHLVWLGVQGMRHSSPVPQRMPLPPADFHTQQLFAALALTECSGGNANDTVNRLDVDSFLYAAVLCAGAQLCSEIVSGFYSSDRPITLPADITCQLCTPEQANWWSAVHKIYSKQMTSRTIVDSKWDLLRGVEVIRAIGNHGLDPILLAALAQTFTERALSFYTSPLNSSSSTVDYISPKLDLSAAVHHNPEMAALESRANLYWKAALPLLERMRQGKAMTNPTSRLFHFHRDQVDATTLNTLIEEGNLFVARQLMTNEDYEEAVEAFKSLRSPYASYHTAEVYLKLAADNNMVDSVMSLQGGSSVRDSMLKEKRARQTGLLEKARDALYVTRDRLHSDQQHPLHRVLPERIKYVESRLDDTEEFLSPSGSPFAVGGGSQTEMNGSAGRSQRQLTYLSTSTPRNIKVNNSSPRTQAVTAQPAVAALGPDIENLLQASETRLQDAFKSANTVMAERLESIVDTIMSKLTRLEVSVDEIRRDVAKLQHPDDLYMLGDDDEDYADDVLSFPAASYVTSQPPAPQPQPPAAAAAAAAYYGAGVVAAAAPSRGVHGTATVTYGAPAAAQPPLPPAPSQPPQYYSPQYHHNSPVAAQAAAQHAAAAASIGYYGQGALPFSEGQQLPDFLRPAVAPTAAGIGAGGKLPSSIPVNVVITSSDTLPTGPPPVLPMLSVTIPPKHRLGGGGVVTMSAPPPQTAPPIVNPPTAIINSHQSSVISDAVAVGAHEFQIAMPATANIPSLLHNPPLAALLQHQDDEQLESRTASPTDLEEHDPYPDFKPIIPLPDEVLPTTGEEGEHVLFENRAKLYRFVDKEWKERGIGQLKLLEDRSSKKIRLLMRREQVHKICANHYLTRDMTLNPMPGAASDKAWLWSANDYAEQKLQQEQFCVKFKTADEAANFKEAFEAAQLTLSESANCSSSSIRDEESILRSATNLSTSSSTSTPILSKTSGATVSSPSSKITLGGFTFTSTPTVKPTDEKSGGGSVASAAANKQQAVVPTTAAPANPFNAFAFTFSPKSSTAAPTINILKTPIFTTPTGPQLFLNKSSSSTTTTTTTTTTSKPTTEAAVKGDMLLKSALKSSSSLPKTVQIEGVENNVKVTSQLRRPHMSVQELVSSDAAAATPTFIEKSSGAVDFAALAKSAATTAVGGGFKKSETFKGFEGSGSLVFGGGSKGVAGDDDGGEEGGEEFVPTAEFRPVIALPALVAVRTGEEEERVLYEQRAKLLRFDPEAREWKERGVGKMKILHNASNGTVRFLMRREQVLKVCCNHRVTADFKMELSSNSDRAYTWYALDYSEATPTREMFALRFKTAEQAADFRAAVDDALELVNTSLGLSEVSSGDVTANSSCVTEGGSSGDEGGSWPGPVKITELHSVTTKTSKHQQPSLKEMFKPKAGSWECTGCLVRNNADIKKCPACGTMKEVTPSQSASKQPPPTSKQQPQSSTTSKTSSQPSLSEMFKPKAGSWECQGCLVRNNAEVKQCPACGTWKDGEQADSSSAAQSTTKSTLTFGSNVFGTSPAAASTGFSFGIPPAATSSTDKLSSTGTTAFSFGTPAAVSATQSSTKFSFGSMFASSNTSSAQSVVSNIFGVTSGGEKEGEDSKTAVFGDVSSTKPQETSGSIFGGVPSTNKPQESDVGSIFGGANSQSAAKTNFSFGGGSSAAAFVFQGQGDASKKFEFNFSGLQHPKSPPATAESDDSEADGEDGHDESNDSIHFHPVIPLPDQVPVTTGEEEESALYTHRAKLFRFMEGEWKERGIGDVKILKHNATGKLRLLMRREIVLKVCLNHFLTAELTFQPKDEKTWLWCAIDYSEGEVLKEKFALRFKTAEIAKEFKDAVDAALAGFKDVPEEKTIDTSLSAVMNSFSFSLPTNQSTPPPSTNTTPFSFSSKGESSSGGGGSTTNKSIFGGSATTVGKADSDDDVQVVYETVVTPEEREAALSLQLPPTFYAYKQAPPCPGCIGCEPEEDEEKEDGGGLEKSASLVGKTSEKSIFQSPAASGAGKTSSKSSPLAASVLNVADSTSVGVGAPSFSFKFAESAASPAAGGLFGGKASTETLSSATPIFGAGAGGLFGKSSSTTTTSATPIFGGTAFGKSTSSENPPSSATPIFGATTFGKSTSSENPPSSATPIFGATTFGKSTSSENPPSSATPIFGGTAFGKSASSENPPSSATPIFGATTFGKSASSENPSSTPNSIFGSSGTAVFGGAAKSSATSWGTTAATGMLFGSPASNNSSNNNNNKQETTAQNNNSSSSNGPGFLFKEAMSFSSLASAGSGDGEGVGGAGGLKKAPENFKWGTAQPVFGSLKKKTNNSEENEEEEDAGGDEEEEVVNSEDIHFEPVVPMPPLIEVKTGEEDEEKVFGERAKLYRFDADLKEWKERGVGEMKILHHPAKRTYRLLLRRELVHKVVCNHLITGDMELGPMATSNQAFAWTAMNLAEEYQAPQLEQLAVRFKNVDLALAFKAKMDQCTAQVKAIKLAQREEKVQMKKNGQNSGSPTKEQRLLSSYEREEYDDEEDEDYDEDDDEDDDDDDDNDDDDENDYEDNTIDDAK